MSVGEMMAFVSGVNVVLCLRALGMKAGMDAFITGAVAVVLLVGAFLA